MIKIVIDGKELEVAPGTSIIKAADDAKIKIPRFCYHEKLSIAANCRMCLVEVVNAPKVMAACATPVAEGMQVKTQSSKALMAQRSVMEFLLINHPLDCPICDQGGECELQDVSMGYGSGISRFNQGKRSVQDENIGPLIATGMTRCIHCTRCVRFGEEVAGVKELGGVGRGEHLEIRSFLNNSVDSELSGNMIDLCPVGALTSKPYRFSARAWELEQRSSIAAHDAVGSNIHVHSIKNNLKRVVPKHNEAINESWLSDRDRFSYEGLNHDERLLTPLMNMNGKLQPVSWETALSSAAEAIKEQVAKNANGLIGLLSPNATVEEGYVLQKLFMALGSSNIDYKLRNYNKFNPDYTGTHGIKLAEIENADNILVIGSSLRKSMPLLNHRIRKAFLKGAKVNAISVLGSDVHKWNLELNIEQVVSSELLLLELAGVLKHLSDLGDVQYPNGGSLNTIKVSDSAQKIAVELKNSVKPVLIFSELAVNHPDSKQAYKLFNAIKKLLNCGTVVFSYGANSQGLFYSSLATGTNSTGNNLNILDMCQQQGIAGTYLLFNVEPEYDCADGLLVLENLKKAKKVISFATHVTDTMATYADIVLPLAPFTETSGTFVNIDAKWQSFSAAVAGANNSQVRPGWKILCALANLLDVEYKYFAFQSSAEVKQEVYNLSLNHKQETVSADLENVTAEEIKSSIATFDKNSELAVASLLTEVNCYKTDSIVRRAASLQKTHDASQCEFIFISENLAKKMNLQLDKQELVSVALVDNFKQRVVLKSVVDASLPENTAYLTTGHEDTLFIGRPYSQIIISKK